jgi:hypothetical protein
MGSINNLTSNFLQSVLGTALQGAGLTTNTTANSVSRIGTPTDNGHLSPFAQLMSALQQVQQSDPAKYQQLTQQIATNLQNAAKTAQGDGNSTAANQLNQLATDFTNASASGQLPNIQDLAQALAGHHHHHHHHSHTGSASPESNSSTGSNSSSTSSSNANQTVNQLLSAFQANGTQSGSLDPMTIIMDTLSNAGISVSSGS